MREVFGGERRRRRRRGGGELRGVGGERGIGTKNKKGNTYTSAGNDFIIAKPSSAVLDPLRQRMMNPISTLH